jgi:hypothetical protein
MADMREMFSSSNAMTAEEERRFMERQAKEGNEMLQLERNLKKLNKGKGKKKKEDSDDIGMAYGGAAKRMKMQYAGGGSVMNYKEGGAMCGRPTGQGYGKARKG